MEEQDTFVSLGSCCNCGKEGESVRNIITLDLRSPEPGIGCWGCLQCGIDQAGAVAVLCDPCAKDYLENAGTIQNACIGSPADNRRIPVNQLTTPFHHDLAKHSEDIPWYDFDNEGNSLKSGELFKMPQRRHTERDVTRQQAADWLQLCGNLEILCARMERLEKRMDRIEDGRKSAPASEQV